MRYKLSRFNQVDQAAFELIDELVELLLEVDFRFGYIPEEQPKRLFRFLVFVKGDPLSPSQKNLLQGLLNVTDTECRNETQKTKVHL